MSRRRHLSPEERALWDQVARSARALPGRTRLDPPQPRPGPAAATADRGRAAHAQRMETHIPEGFDLGLDVPDRLGHDLARPIADSLRDAPVSMDKRQFVRLSKGRLDPEARLDLHGMTLDRAHGALTRFITTARLRGQRLVLVITGKGRDSVEDGPIPRRRGALRHEVPHWLRAAPLESMVLEVRHAHRRHGGDGALYVYLRKPR